MEEDCKFEPNLGSLDTEQDPDSEKKQKGWEFRSQCKGPGFIPESWRGEEGVLVLYLFQSVMYHLANMCEPLSSIPGGHVYLSAFSQGLFFQSIPVHLNVWKTIFHLQCPAYKKMLLHMVIILDFPTVSS